MNRAVVRAATAAVAGSLLGPGAEALGAGSEPKRFVVPLDPAARRWADAQLAPWPRPWLLFGVGARWVTKRWPLCRFKCSRTITSFRTIAIAASYWGAA